MTVTASVNMYKNIKCEICIKEQTSAQRKHTRTFPRVIRWF
jgi:hypothetical protein